MTGWVSVNERLPEKYITVLVLHNNQVFPGFYNVKAKLWLTWSGWKDLRLDNTTPTHWRHLPQPPEAE